MVQPSGAPPDLIWDNSTYSLYQYWSGDNYTQIFSPGLYYGINYDNNLVRLASSQYVA